MNQALHCIQALNMFEHERAPLHCVRRVNESNGHKVWYRGSTTNWHLLCEDRQTKSFKLSELLFFHQFFLIVTKSNTRKSYQNRIIWNQHRRKENQTKLDMESKKLLIMFWAVALATFSCHGAGHQDTVIVLTNFYYNFTFFQGCWKKLV